MALNNSSGTGAFYVKNMTVIVHKNSTKPGGLC